MRDFSWNYFKNTGQIDAYLLYKEYVTITDVENNFSDNAYDIVKHGDE